MSILQSTEEIVQATNIVKSFGDFTPLNGVNLSIKSGEFVALVGKSGSGKTTLLRLLSGLDTADSGNVLVPKNRTIVFQEPRLINSSKVWKNVAIGLPSNDESRQAALSALDEVGLLRNADSWPSTLSGGEAQRVAIARALVRKPQLLLLDEPFGALDALTRINIQALVANLCATYKPATLLVTHDVEEAVLLADRVLVLGDGVISKEVVIDLPRPRSLGGRKFEGYRLELLAELGVRREILGVQED